MWEVIKKVKWWMWIGLIVAILLIWQYLSGWAYSRKLYNMALDNLRTDQSRIVKVLEENQQMYETEITKLNQDLQSIQKQKVQVQVENERLRGINNELQNRLENVTVPDDIDSLLDLLHKLGLKSAGKGRRP